MTSSNHTDGQSIKWVRYVARVLALIGAGWWTYHIVISIRGIMSMWMTGPSPTILSIGLLILLIPWGSVVVAWIWEGVGGVLLILEGIVALFTSFIYFYSLKRTTLVAGILFLVIWQVTRPSRSQEKNIKIVKSSGIKALGTISMICGVVGLIIFGIPLGIGAIICGMPLLGIVAIACGVPTLAAGASEGKIGFILGILDTVVAIGIRLDAFRILGFQLL